MSLWLGTRTLENYQAPAVRDTDKKVSVASLACLLSFPPHTLPVSFPSGEMANYSGNSDPLFSAYPHSAPVYDDSPLNFPYQYSSGESSSSTLTRNLPNSSSQSHMAGDLPELYYDQNWPSPPSATSLNMISTPPPDWQMPWQLSESCYTSNCEPPYLPTRWQEDSFNNAAHRLRPTVAPIDTNCSWNNFQQKTTEKPSVLLDSYDESDLIHKVHPYPTSHPHHSSFANNTKTMSNFGNLPPPSVVSSSPTSANPTLPIIMDPMLTSSSCPPTMGQAPLKLHQPRPSRRIPIISLSKLASACDAIRSNSKQPDSSVSDKNLHTSRSSMSSFTTVMDPSSSQFNAQTFPVRNNPAAYISTFQVGNPSNNSAKVITCSCGCGQSTSSY